MIECDGVEHDATAPGPARVGWLRAVGRGLAGRCPRCGTGRLFGRFLKVRPACEVCGLELHHHRADDLPPYLVIFVVGHLVGAGILTVQETFEDLPLWFEMTLWPLVTVALAVLLIQPAKGGVVGLQYALGMHGFGAAAAAEGTAAGANGPAAADGERSGEMWRGGRDDGRNGGRHDGRDRGRQPGRDLGGVAPAPRRRAHEGAP